MAEGAVLWEDIYGPGEPTAVLREDIYGPPAGPSIWSSLSESVDVAFKALGKWQTLDMQKEMAKLQAEAARMRIQQGMSGAVGPTMGGFSWLTILAFGGVGILILLMFKD